MKDELTPEEKIQALVTEGGYTRAEAIAELIDMGELDGDE